MTNAGMVGDGMGARKIAALDDMTAVIKRHVLAGRQAMAPA